MSASVPLHPSWPQMYSHTLASVPARNISPVSTRTSYILWSPKFRLAVRALATALDGASAVAVLLCRCAVLVCRCGTSSTWSVPSAALSVSVDSQRSHSKRQLWLPSEISTFARYLVPATSTVCLRNDDKRCNSNDGFVRATYQDGVESIPPPLLSWPIKIDLSSPRSASSNLKMSSWGHSCQCNAHVPIQTHVHMRAHTLARTHARTHTHMHMRVCMHAPGPARTCQSSETTPV